MNLTLQWRRVLHNPVLRDLPFKIELNRFGQILMSPASNKHGIVQHRVGSAIERLRKSGVVISECSILTSDGVRVADVAWASNNFIAEFGERTPYPKAPEICVEITSPSNSAEEIDNKIRLYLEKGAVEVWVVNENGTTSFYSHVGVTKKSKLVPKFRL